MTAVVSDTLSSASQEMETSDELSIDFGYSFLRGIDPLRPPATITVPRRALEAMGNMERQYWEIKSANYNVIIFFKKGKFYELYDYDAVIAHKEFGLKMVMDTTNRGKMRLAGVPEQSFSEWARLFIFRGYKVGRVDQMKDADAGAESPGKPKAKVIARELVEVITPGTVTDAEMLAGHAEVYVLAVLPMLDAAGGSGASVDAFAVDLSRHVVLHCPCVGSGATGQEQALRALSALLRQLNPTEVLVPAAAALPMSRECDKAAVQLADSVRAWVQAEGFVPEELPVRQHGPVYASAADMMEQYFVSLRLQRHLPLLRQPTLYDRHLPQDLQKRGGAAAVVKQEEATHDSPTSEVQGGKGAPTILEVQRRTDPGMILDTSSIANLELITNLFDNSETNTLYQVVNHCVTNGGRRLMRAWVLRPSASHVVVSARQDAVRYVVENQLIQPWDAILGAAGGSSVASLASQNSSAGLSTPQSTPGKDCDTPDARSSAIGKKRGRSTFAVRFGNLAGLDFERQLSRLADLRDSGATQVAYVDPMLQYSKNLRLILSALQGFGEMLQWAQQFRTQCESCSGAPPRLLEELLADLEGAADSVAYMETLFDREAATVSGTLIPGPGTSPAYDAAVAELERLDSELNAARAEASVKHFGGAKVGFTDLGKDLFMYEVAPRDAPSRTPDGMTERARSAKSVKYVVDELQPIIQRHRDATAAKSAALQTVLCAVAGRMCERCAPLQRASAALAHIDCLFSLAQLFSMHQTHMCFPTIVPHTTTSVTAPSGAADSAVLEVPAAELRAADMVHPLLLLARTGANTAPVANSVTLDAAAGRVLVLTGPNMAGKSTVMRTLAANVILAQLGGGVFAREMRLSCVDRIFTRIGARDASDKGQSTLYVELSETAELLRAATPRSLCLVDELGRGTSTHDGMAIAHAALQALAAAAPLTVFSTHYHALALECARDRRAGVQLGYMSFALTPRGIAFLYQLAQGVCERSYGVEVALMAGLPAPLVEEAKVKSVELTHHTALHEDIATLRHLCRAEEGGF